MAFDAGTIVATMDIDRTSFQRALAEAKAEADKGVSVKVTTDTSQVRSEGDKAGQDLGRAISDGTNRGLSSGGTSSREGGSWIAAAIGLGAPLAGPLAVAGLGFAAFGGLAVKSVLPITKAISGPGGVAGAWNTLDNRQRQAVQSTQLLGREYSALAKTLEPQVFQTYNTALQFGNGLLRDATPLAHRAAGAIESFLIQFKDQSGLNGFVRFSTGQVVPAINLIGTTITKAAHLIFNIAESLTPLGLSELRLINNILTFADGTITALNGISPALVPILGGFGQILLITNKLRGVSIFEKLFQGAGAATGFTTIISRAKVAGASMAGFAVASEGTAVALGEVTFASRITAGAMAALEAVTPLGWAILAAGALTALYLAFGRGPTEAQKFIDAAIKSNQASGFNVAGYDAAAKSIGGQATAMHNATTAVYNLHTGLQTGTISIGDAIGATDQLTDAQKRLAQQGANINSFLTTLQVKYGLNRTQAIQLANASGVLASDVGKGGAAMKQAAEKADAMADSNKRARNPVSALDTDMQGMANTTLTLTNRVSDLNSALNLFFNPAVSADQSLIALKNDALQLTTALAKSAGATGLQTQAQRDARGAFDTYISQVADTATKTFQATGKTGDYNAVINRSIPFLEKAAGKNQALKREIQLLIDTEKGQHTENVNMKVTAEGHWSVTSSNTSGITGPSPGGHHLTANGWYVSGGTPGVDSVPIMAMPGELVVPTSIVSGGGVDHLRGSIPGFAAGGVVGSTSGSSIPALSRWESGENRDTLNQLIKDTAEATAKGIKSAQLQANQNGGFAGPIGKGGKHAIAEYAASYATGLNHPYVWGGNTPAGWDCSGFSSWVYHHFGYSPPRTSQTQQLWASKAPDEPGALVFFYGTGGTASHVGISMGNGSYAGADNESVGTVIHSSGGNSGFGVPPGGFAGGTSGAPAGWAMVGERGMELVHFNGGETVIPHAQSMGMVGLAAGAGFAGGTNNPADGGKVPKKNPVNAKYLNELAKFVKELDKDEEKATKFRKAQRTLIDSEQLWMIMHPHAGSGAKLPHIRALSGLQRQLADFNKREGKTETTLEQEIKLLRNLTGYPKQKKYGGSGVPKKDPGDPAGGDDGGGDTGGGDSSSSGPTSMAGPTPAWLLPFAGSGGNAGDGNGGFTQSDSSSGTGTAPSPGFGGSASAGIGFGATMSGGSAEAQILAQLLASHQKMTDILERAPVRTASGVSDAFDGVARRARLNTGRS